jgi:hypothetical protein
MAGRGLLRPLELGQRLGCVAHHLDEPGKHHVKVPRHPPTMPAMNTTVGRPYRSVR